MKKILVNPVENYITVNNTQLCYIDSGVGEIPVIFIHGFPFRKEMWQLQVNFLKSTHRVIAYDLRGFGDSTNDELTVVSISLFADDLILFMDSLHIEKAIVCGLSMGGYIMLDALDRHPDRFAAAILCDTQCIADTVEGKENRSKTAIQIGEEGLQQFAQGFLSKILDKSTLGNNFKLIGLLKSMILAASTKSVIDSLHALANRSATCSTLNQILVPTLIICGKNDLVTPVAEANYLHENIKCSCLFIIDNAGHMSNLEQPEQFNTRVLDFISNLPKEIPSNLYGKENKVSVEDLTK